jgi:hypothetical protein
MVRRIIFCEKLTQNCPVKSGPAAVLPAWINGKSAGRIDTGPERGYGGTQPRSVNAQTCDSGRMVLPQANGMSDLVKFLVADGIEAFAGGGQLLVNLNRLLSHDLVGILRTAYEEKIRAGGHAFVAIGVEPEAEHQGPALQLSLGRVRH